jgi:hypothetical protein
MFANHDVDGQDLVNLALYQMVHPKVYNYEVCAYIHNHNLANPLYSQFQISWAALWLGLFWKAASSTSDLAYSLANLFKHYKYWNQAFHDGIARESTRDLIDINESGYRLNSQNRSFGKVTREKRCNVPGKYKHGNIGVNLLMAISGDERVSLSFLLHKCYTAGRGKSVVLLWFYAQFMQLVSGKPSWARISDHDGQLEHSQASNYHSFDIFMWALCCVLSTVLVLLRISHPASGRLHLGETSGCWSGRALMRIQTPKK